MFIPFLTPPKWTVLKNVAPSGCPIMAGLTILPLLHPGNCVKFVCLADMAGSLYVQAVIFVP